MNTLSILKKSILYLGSDFRLWIFFAINFLVALVGTYALPTIISGLLLLYWLIGWRRSLSHFMIMEFKNSPYPLISAFYYGFYSLITTWWLTLWYGLLSCGEFLIEQLEFSVLDHGLALVVILVTLLIAQFFADFFLYPLIADRIIAPRDLLHWLIIYGKSYLLSVVLLMMILLLLNTTIFYLIALFLSLLNISNIIFYSFNWSFFYFALTVVQTFYYLQIHYPVTRVDD